MDAKKNNHANEYVQVMVKINIYKKKKLKELVFKKFQRILLKMILN